MVLAVTLAGTLGHGSTLLLLAFDTYGIASADETIVPTTIVIGNQRRVAGLAVIVGEPPRHRTRQMEYARERHLDDGRGMTVVIDDGLVQWLLEGDPAIRWRVLRDLTGASEHEVARERSLVATEGWGARLLAAQDRDGGWGGGVYSPKWTSTTYTLLRLLWLGLPSGHPGALRGCDQLWRWQARWRVPETCIVSMLVRLTSAHGYDTARLDGLLEYLLDQQLADGGWNCATRTDKGKHSSFHTSIQALEALEAYAQTGGRLAVRQPLRRGRDFFLQHRLYRSHRTGAVAIRGSTRFPAFPEWHFDVLRGLEHFGQSGARRDARLSDAIEVLRKARRRDGRWPTYSPYSGRQWFQLEPSGASRWNTARVLRVLRWWDD
jgi:hypothetical protein